MVELAVIVATIAAKVASYTIGPIGRYILRPIASRCPFKNLWEYKSNLENMKTKLKNLEAERERAHGLTNVGVEPLPDISDWLDKATNIINEVSGLISEDNPERGCCEGCNYSNLKESYQHRNDVARKLKDVAQLLQEALRSISLWEYKSNLENLKKEVEKLEAKRDSVKCSIKAGEEPLPDVKLWQDKVNSIINEVSGLTSRHIHQQQNYVARILNNVAQLLQEVREFKKLSFQPIPEETWLQSSEGYKAFKSRTSILKEIVEALSKPDVDLVGIYGMGGIGKTTLAKQVARQTIQDKVFNKIVFVEVSQTPNTKRIQGEIGSKLGLKFREEEELSERARQLYQQLKNEEKTLLILDNIWESVNFETMGIPYKHDSKGLKLLMTARKIDVLTDGIEHSQHNFSVKALEWEDAWSLFKSKAGTCVDRRDLLPIAVDVAKECGGVPIAIVTIAKALNNKGTYEWRKVLRELRNPSPDSFDGIAANVYRSIELSYNYLETEELKATFLLCSSMGSTSDASIEDLLRYGIGLGLFNRFNTMEEERDNVCSLISTLKASSLLVDAPKSEEFLDNQLSEIERFAMHDIVCDIARLIAHKDKNVFIVIDNIIPRSWESENLLTNCTSITLDNVSELSEDLQLVCPQLKFLYVKTKFFYLKISDKFFACMPKLRVLHLIRMDLLQLSTPFSDLVNLQTLCLECCMLKDIADVGELKNLEIFSFRGGNGFQLSEKLHQLTKLRLLELDSIGLSSIPSKFILSFKKLEALYMRGTTIEWEAEKSNNGSKNTSRDVLEHLSNLTSLEICVPEIPEAIMLRGLLSPKLERYKIKIGKMGQPSSTWGARHYVGDWGTPCKTSRFLEVQLNTNEDGIISGLKAIRQLLLNEVPGIANNFCSLDRMGFPELENLRVENNSHILHIVDTVSREDVFPILKSLILWNLINLKTICNGPLGMKLFHQLRTIKVTQCNQLTHTFSLASDRVFQELEEIVVLHCENMEEIFAISDQVHEIKFSKLCNLRLVSLPRLKSFCGYLKTTNPILQLTSDTKPREIILEEQDVPKPLFNEKVVLTNLETLEINNINICDNQLPTMAGIPNLTCLIISNLANLRRFGSEDYIEFPLLREIRIQNCPKFKEIFFDDKVGVPSLEQINIFKMDNLKMIWHNQFVEDSFPKLKSLRVDECQKLSTLFRSNMCGRFLSLETLNVSGCGSLEEILDLREINSEESHLTTSTQFGELCTYNPLVLSFANLQNLKISKCQSLKTIVAKEEEAKEASGTTRFVFPKLTFLKLCELPDLRTFYPGRYTVEWPVLKRLKIHQYGIYEHPKTMTGFQKLSFLDDKAGFEFGVQKLWPSLLPIMSSWDQNLTRLILYGCDNLEELFPYSMAVTEELREKKIGNTIVFPLLNYLQMKQLANLKGLCSGYHIECPTLKKFKISNCPKMTAFIFDDKVKVPSLKNVKISSMDKLTKIWDSQLAKNFIPKLKSLQVKRCQKLLTLLPLKMCEIFLSLETLNISDCDSLENIFDLHEINSKEGHSERSTQSKELYTIFLTFFANLQNLKVSECGSLKSLFSVSKIWDNQLAKNFIPKLESLQVERCQKLLSLLPLDMCESFSSLKTLNASDCGSLEKIFDLHKVNSEERHSATSTQSKELYTTVLTFANLQNLKVSECGSLKSLFSVSNVAEDREAAEETHAVTRFVFPKLIHLELYKLTELRTFYTARYTVEWPVLRMLLLCDCCISDTDDNKLMKRQSIPHWDSFSSWNAEGLKIHIERIWLWFLLMMSSSFQNLRKLVIYNCGNLKELFPSFDLVEEELKEKEMGNTISFPRLECLEMEYLANLTRLCSEYYNIKFPSLKEWKMSHCPELKAFIFDHKVKIPSLKNVEISSMDKLTKIWDNQLIGNFIPKLESLQVERCQKLLTLLPSDMRESLSSLKTLNVTDCGSLEKIFDLHEVNSEERHSTTSTQSKELYTTVLSFANLYNLEVSECGSLKSLFSVSNVAKDQAAKEMHATVRFVFPHLIHLKLYNLPELRTFYPARYTVEWPILKTLLLYDCCISDTDDKLMKRQSFFPRSRFPFWWKTGGFEIHIEKSWLWFLPMMSSSFQNLKKLGIYDCGNLKELFPSFDLVEEELREREMGNIISFPRLEYLEMEYLANLTRLCSENYNIEFPSLKEWKISHCPELKAFIFDHKVKVPSLKNVEISSMDKLTNIWDNQLAKNFIPKLESLQVERCQKLLTLLPLDMCESFLSLKTLNVSDCGSLEKIFDLHEVNSEERHCATSIQSKELYTTVLAFANLQNLKVSECGSLKSLFSVSNVAKDREAAEETPAVTRFVFPKLIHLELCKLTELRTFYTTRYTVEWPVLRTLLLCDCCISNTDDNKLMKRQSSFPRWAFPCLENLTLAGKDLMMMWQGQDPEPLFQNFKILQVYDESTAGYWSQACKPVLQYLGNVKYMWKQNFKLDLILPNFEEIVVKCDSFISLMPPSASFQNLTSLTVYGCYSLEHIGTFSMAQNLVKLVSLTISWCRKIVEVLRNHGDVTGDKILFSNLKCLILRNLRSLTSFCSWNFTLEFPSLEELEVTDCPNMKIFSHGELTTPKLRGVRSDWRLIELCPHVDVRTTIQQLPEQEQDWNDYFYPMNQSKTEVIISTDESEQDWSD